MHLAVVLSAAANAFAFSFSDSLWADSIVTLNNAILRKQNFIMGEFCMNLRQMKRKHKTVFVSENLRPLDFFIVHEIKDGLVTLVSKFKSGNQEEITILKWKIPLDKFSDLPMKGDYFRTDNKGVLKKTRFNRNKFRITIALKKTIAEFSTRAKPETAMERETYIKNFRNRFLENSKR